MTTPLTSKAVLILFQVPWDWYPRATFGYGNTLQNGTDAARVDAAVTLMRTHPKTRAPLREFLAEMKLLGQAVAYCADHHISTAVLHTPEARP
jgi:hypothetical protein